MKSNYYSKNIRCTVASGLAALLVAGCASTNSSSPSGSVAGHFPSKYRTNDGRNIVIGPSSAADGGWKFKEPHMDKCWLADGFTFTGYDTLYIAPTLSTAKYQPDEARPHQLAKENLPIELARGLKDKGLFTSIVTNESEIKPGAKVLKLENTIVRYSKGGGGARYWVGLYGGGQPLLLVDGRLMDGDKPVFTYTMKRSGVSGEARFGGAFMKDEDIQIQDIRSLVLDLSDFMAAIGGKYQTRN